MEPQPSTKVAIADVAPATSLGFVPRARRLFTAARMLQSREKIRIREGIAQIPGLMALLMKPRNGLKWTKAERAELRTQLSRLSRLSLYLAMAALPFTTLTLPLVAWWLDQRQKKRS
ncbi:MAG: hypothetical protein NUV55_04035 [Sulfuricaulis sp.]|uniref:hypothetical protein n=1 Tax=Sulfuricaulis sp. TaxID=2003553 RepID=UPI0025FBB4DD|nr:hypothetical protein [Sulfuricaulis sp.]MCR4346366.1 hypothetical protein [Sulfuricaulis sp.]